MKRRSEAVSEVPLSEDVLIALPTLLLCLEGARAEASLGVGPLLPRSLKNHQATLLTLPPVISRVEVSLIRPAKYTSTKYDLPAFDNAV